MNIIFPCHCLFMLFPESLLTPLVCCMILFHFSIYAQTEEVILETWCLSISRTTNSTNGNYFRCQREGGGRENSCSKGLFHYIQRLVSAAVCSDSRMLIVQSKTIYCLLPMFPSLASSECCHHLWCFLLNPHYHILFFDLADLNVKLRKHAQIGTGWVVAHEMFIKESCKQFTDLSKSICLKLLTCTFPAVVLLEIRGAIILLYI